MLVKFKYGRNCCDGGYRQLGGIPDLHKRIPAMLNHLSSLPASWPGLSRPRRLFLLRTSTIGGRRDKPGDDTGT
jgi:hypothetical protein